MYETIMDLPLFKGVGTNHVSSFLEKTSVDFHKYQHGQLIIKRGEPVKNLKFLLSGRIRIVAEVFEGEVKLSSVAEGDEVIGATRLYGLHPHYDVTIEAIDNVSVMEFSKMKYIDILQSDPIYMMNFANMLSMSVQRTTDIISLFVRADLSRILAEWLVLFTSRRSLDIKISGISALKELYGECYVDQNLDKLQKLTLVVLKDDIIEIPDREALIEYVSTPMN